MTRCPLRRTCRGRTARFGSAAAAALGAEGGRVGAGAGAGSGLPEAEERGALVDRPAACATCQKECREKWSNEPARMQERCRPRGRRAHSLQAPLSLSNCNEHPFHFPCVRFGSGRWAGSCASTSCVAPDGAFRYCLRVFPPLPRWATICRPSGTPGKVQCAQGKILRISRPRAIPAIIGMRNFSSKETTCHFPFDGATN